MICWHFFFKDDSDDNAYDEGDDKAYYDLDDLTAESD